MSKFVVMPASRDDVLRIARLQFEACASDPGFQAIFPRGASPISVAHLTRQFEDLMNSNSADYIMIAKEPMRGEIVSYAIWHFIPPRTGETVEEDLLGNVDETALPADANIKLGQRLLQNSNRKRYEIISRCFGLGKPYAYLGAIGTKPQYQGQGAAQKLVSWDVDRADHEKLPAYIEGSPAGLHLYQKFGFGVQEHLEIDLGPDGPRNVANYCLVRFSQPG